jgi:tRNA pseudouridine65 synthase
MLDVLFQDDYLIAINKPHGLLVHRSPIAAEASEFAVQKLRDQIGQRVYPAHRLDRKTGGVLLFALRKEADSPTQKLFQDNQIDKSYLAIVRGYAPEEGVIDYPLHNENGVLQDALTRFKRLATSEIPLPFGKFETSRYSLMEIFPDQGRMHQIRKHFAHIMHPILADRPHGCNKQNRLWKETFQMDTMMLHARCITFPHPITGEQIRIQAPLQSEFIRVLSILNITQIITD